VAAAGHNLGMRRPRALASLAILLPIALVGCKSSSDAASDLPRPSKAFCQAAAKYDKRVQLAKLPEQIELVSGIVEHAPVDIERDANTFLDALKRRQDGDTSVVDNPKIETAVHNVNRRAGQDCGWYKREGM
jgi:predicted lipid carrier protein YhbT